MSTVRDERSLKWLIVFSMWLISLIATFGSLFLSEVMEFIPCSLCWYQRIFMYPLILIFLVGVLKLDRGVITYSFPITLVGWLFAIYHNLLHFGIIPESATPCQAGVPCSTKYIEWFGFITIPFLSLVAFSLILILTLTLNKEFNK